MMGMLSSSHLQVVVPSILSDGSTTDGNGDTVCEYGAVDGVTVDGVTVDGEAVYSKIRRHRSYRIKRRCHERIIGRWIIGSRGISMKVINSICAARNCCSNAVLLMVWACRRIARAGTAGQGQEG